MQTLSFDFQKKKNHTQTHKVNNPVRAPLSPCHHQHYGHQQHN